MNGELRLGTSCEILVELRFTVTHVPYVIHKRVQSA